MQICATKSISMYLCFLCKNVSFSLSGFLGYVLANTNSLTAAWNSAFSMGASSSGEAPLKCSERNLRKLNQDQITHLLLLPIHSTLVLFLLPLKGNFRKHLLCNKRRLRAHFRFLNYALLNPWVSPFLFALIAV